MAYSFFPYEPKTPFSETVRRVWWVGIAVMFFLLVAGGYTYWKKGRTSAAIQTQINQQQTLQQQLLQLQKQLEESSKLHALDEQINTGNRLLQDQMKNLLALVPNDTVLHEFELMEGALLYSGVSADRSTLQTQLAQALSGQYRLILSNVNDTNESKHFYFYFMQSGDENGT